jgi:SNF2 family DNA or RNA helicase
MEPLSERKTKKECLDLPDKIYVTIPAKGTRVGQGTHIIHKAMAQDGFAFTAENSAQVFQAHEHKLSVLVELLETLENKQVVIYVAFKNSVDLIANHITKKFKKKSLKFLGSMDEKKRIHAIEEFRGGEIQYLVATMQALNTGVTLTNCNNVIYYSRSFSRIERLQSEDRFHRINQLNKVTYYDIIGEGFDKKAYELAQSKKSYDEIKEQLEKFEG